MRASLLAGELARRAPRGALRLAGVRAGFQSVEELRWTCGGREVPLLAGYRDVIKSSWRGEWWSTRALLGLHRRLELPPAERAAAEDLIRARTLPRPVGEYSCLVTGIAGRYPGALLETGRIDDGMEVLELAPREAELSRLAALYRATAAAVCLDLRRAGVSLADARILDVGTGSGYLAFALAGAGVGSVVGVDLDPEGYVLPAQRVVMRRLLCAGREAAVRLEEGDVHALPFADASFDAVISVSALEHFADLRQALAEVYRVMRPGGVSRHGVDPWFGKAGGHAVCTLDFPWGHVRSTEDEFAHYVRTFRPHESALALSYRSTGFQRPPLTLCESRRALLDAGYQIVGWRAMPLSARDQHRLLLDRTVLADCRRLHPEATKTDLLTLSYKVVARRGHPPRRR